MARRPQRFTEDDFESLEGRASKTEQKKSRTTYGCAGRTIGAVKHQTNSKTSSRRAFN